MRLILTQPLVRLLGFLEAYGSSGTVFGSPAALEGGLY